MDANSVDAQRSSPLPGSEEPARALHLQPVRLRRRRPVYVPGKFNTDRDKLFFFWAQEWINYDRTDISTGIVPSEADAARRLQRAAAVHRTRSTGARSPSMIRSPASPSPGTSSLRTGCSPNGTGLLNIYPVPTPGFRLGSTNWLGTSPNPSRTRKDTLRLDFAPNSQNNDLVPRLALQLQGRRRLLAATFANARRDWDRPNDTASLSWTSTFKSSVDQRGHGRHGARPRVHRGLPGHRHLRAQQVRDQLSLHLPREQAHPRQDPHHHRWAASRRWTAVPIPPLRRDRSDTVSDNLTHVPRPPHLQGRRLRSSTPARTTWTRST